MFFMYSSLRDEKELKSGNPSTYRGILEEPVVLDLVNKNYLLVDPFATIFDEAFERLNSDIHTNMESYGLQENLVVNEELAKHSGNSGTESSETMEKQPSDLVNATFLSNAITLVTDYVIDQSIRSLNTQQIEVFNVVHQWLEIVSKV